jgi:hypothetical protein
MRFAPTILFGVGALLLLLSVVKFGPPVSGRHRLDSRTPHSSPPPPPPPPPPPIWKSHCGDDVCDTDESWETCFSDCPGVTTPRVCAEEPHSDPGGSIAPGAPFGMEKSAKAKSAAECCERCQQHAANPKHAAQKCNSWVFCPLPVCWGLDTGWNQCAPRTCCARRLHHPRPPKCTQSGLHEMRLTLRSSLGCLSQYIWRMLAEVAE